MYIIQLLGERYTQTIKTFVDGTVLFYDGGYFDGWNTYINTDNKDILRSFFVRMKTDTRNTPKDYKVFYHLQKLADAYGNDTVYKDFVAFYDMTGPETDPAAIDLIHELSLKYADPFKTEILFLLLYCCMVAEYHHPHTILNKRIKRLGVHQILMDVPRMKPYDAANYSKFRRANVTTKYAKSLNEECLDRGF